MSSKEKDFDSIIELFKKDYSLENEKNLKQKVGEIEQDHIKRGLYSTACIAKQLQAHYDYIDSLINYIIESLKKDFADIPLKPVKEKLFAIVNEEYKKLGPFANVKLVNAGLFSQSALNNFERRINDEKGKAKKAIETRCAIIEKQKSAKNNHSSPYIKAGGDIIAGGSIIVGNENKNVKEKQEGALEPKPPELLQKLLWVLKYGRKHWRIILLAIFLLFLWGNFIWPKFDLFSKFYHPKKKVILDDYGRTPLYARTEKRIYDIYEKIENEKLNPWIFINTGVQLQITEYNGKVISYEGVTFEGAPRLIFWSDDFIQPFIEDAIIKVFDQTIEECRKNNLDPEPYISEAKSLLYGFINKVYNRMAYIDQRLSSKSGSNKVGRKDVSFQIDKMNGCLKKHYDAAVLLVSKDRNLKNAD